MKRIATFGLVFALVATAGVLFAQDHPEHPKKKDKPATGEAATPEHPEHPEAPAMPTPTEQHDWLTQLAGEWEYEGAWNMPDGTSMPLEGTESVRSIGGFWNLSELKSADESFTGILTVGFDPEKKQFVGTWIDSMSSYMFQYTGTLDTKTNALTLTASGPNMMTGQGTVNYKETTTLKDKDHKTFTSQMQQEDGSWVTMMTLNYTRAASGQE